MKICKNCESCVLVLWHNCADPPESGYHKMCSLSPNEIIIDPVTGGGSYKKRNTKYKKGQNGYYSAFRLAKCSEVNTLC